MQLSFYMITPLYCDFLRQFDDRVRHNMDAKSSRPFVGIVLEVNGCSYYAPLSSPKPKHQSMPRRVDFLKINGGVWGAINFNNMIPVREDCLAATEMNILPGDTAEEKAYKNLMKNQLSWCNAHRNQILKQAQRLYHIITKQIAPPQLIARCCDFATLEQHMGQYLTMPPPVPEPENELDR